MWILSSSTFDNPIVSWILFKFRLKTAFLGQQNGHKSDLDRFWLIDYRIYDKHTDGLKKLDHVKDMLYQINQIRIVWPLPKAPAARKIQE